MIPQLETERLLIRPWRLEDAVHNYAYGSSPVVGPMAGWTPQASLEEAQKYIEKAAVDPEVAAIVLKSENKPIGGIGLHEDGVRHHEKSREVGYVLAEPYWGQGIMPEAVERICRYAFAEMQLAVLTIQVFDCNAQSKRVAEKCGFTYEGTLRHACKGHDGTIHDLAAYSLLREEFIAAG